MCCYPGTHWLGSVNSWIVRKADLGSQHNPCAYTVITSDSQLVLSALGIYFAEDVSTGTVCNTVQTPHITWCVQQQASYLSAVAFQLMPGTGEGGQASFCR